MPGTGLLLPDRGIAATSTAAAGVLLGAGSFGRVYRGHWLGKDVAVKVLQHNAAHAERVAQECDLIMGSAHPHVVSSLHVVTWCQQRMRQAEQEQEAEGQAAQLQVLQQQQEEGQGQAPWHDGQQQQLHGSGSSSGTDTVRGCGGAWAHS